MLPPNHTYAVHLKNTTKVLTKVTVVFGSEVKEEGKDFILETVELQAGEEFLFGKKTYDMGQWTAVAPVHGIDVECKEVKTHHKPTCVGIVDEQTFVIAHENDILTLKPMTSSSEEGQSQAGVDDLAALNISDESRHQSHDGKSDGSPAKKEEEKSNHKVDFGIPVICTKDVLTKDNSTVTLVLCRGSVLDFVGDAIVNAANTGCLGGGGVDGAISKAGGMTLQRAREALPVLEKGENGWSSVRCRVGEAVTTVGGSLNVGHVIHAVGPNFSDFDGSDSEGLDLLRNAYVACVSEAQKHGFRSIAFSLLSAGIFRGHLPLNTVLETGLVGVCEYLMQGRAGDMKEGDIKEGDKASVESTGENKQGQNASSGASSNTVAGKLNYIVFCAFTANEVSTLEQLMGKL